MKVVGHDGQNLLAEDVDRHRTARRSFGKAGASCGNMFSSVSLPSGSLT